MKNGKRYQLLQSGNGNAERFNFRFSKVVVESVSRSSDRTTRRCLDTMRHIRDASVVNKMSKNRGPTFQAKLKIKQRGFKYDSTSR